MHTLLFVDDEQDIVDSLQRAFRGGYRTFTATSGSEAIAVIEREALDLIICDQRMPGVSGDQVLSHALERQPQAIRILLTGYADMESLVRCVNEAQIYKYLTKPWEPEMLRLTVLRALENLDLSRQKKLLSDVLSQYVSTAVVEQIMADPSRLRLGGERKTLSMLFSDLEGFSVLAERLEPETLTTLLNDYLSEMTELILDEGGTLDKYEGDAIIAFWNAPLDQADHAQRACRTALRCQKRLAELAADYRERFGAVLKARIGLHTGEVVVGNMGSKARFDYSILGAAANLASRLEGANKLFGSAILVSEATWQQSGDAFVGREVGLLKLAGFSTPLRTYELLGLAGETAVPADYPAALSLYQAGHWAEAAAIFARLAEHDPLSRAYAARCREAANTGWNGVWSADGK
jgi:adenylate cyclase